jgi:hypothetical protein
MKQKNFIKRLNRSFFSRQKEQMKSEFSQHFGALYQKPRSRITNYIKENPKKSFWMMTLLLCSNFLLMLFIDTRGVTAKKDPFKSIGDYISKTPLYHSTNGRTAPSIRNIMAMREIKDSLVFYSEKANLKTADDTATLKRLLRKYAVIDPTIFKTDKP